MSQDIVADGINTIMNAIKAGKKEIVLTKYSKVLISVLEIAKKYNYLEDYKLNEKEKQLTIKIAKINKCNAIKPRFYTKSEGLEKYVRRYLPSRNFGILIISTNRGLITHLEAYEKKIGGSLIAYFY